jgi:hypothetical protein
VVGTLICNYVNVKASGNGVDACHCYISLPNGSIPSMMLTNVAATQAKLLQRIADFMANK